MSTYKNDTLKMIENLSRSDCTTEEVITLEDGKQIRRIALKASDYERILPTKRDLANKALQFSGRAGKKAGAISMAEKRELAARTGTNFTAIYHMLNDDKPNLATRDMILCAVLLRDEVPCAEEVRHILMENNREDLYIYTCKKNENCRNLLLRLCIDYAHAGNVCPVTDWLVFTNSVILYFNSRLREHLGNPMSRLEAGEPDKSFLDTHAQLLLGWENQLKAISFCYLSTYRNALLEAYKKKGNLRSNAEAQRSLAERGYHDSYLRAAFSGTGKRSGSRQLLIEAAIEMGCNLKEANLLLRQVPFPVLYPNRSTRDAEDVKAVQALHANPGLLDENTLNTFLKMGEIQNGND